MKTMECVCCGIGREWADLEANMILMWSFVLIKIMLLMCRLLVCFMSLEEKKCVIDISLDLEGSRSPYVLGRIVLWIVGNVMEVCRMALD